MMLSSKLLAQLNEQISFEFFSSNFYLAMAAYCSYEGLDGFKNFFVVQAQEENFHGMKFFDYVNGMGKRVKISSIPAPLNEYESILDVFSHAYEHEQMVTRRIYDLMDVAMEEKEHATISFLKWFIDEQIEEEATFGGIIRKLERIQDNNNALYMLDAELAARTFTPPADANA